LNIDLYVFIYVTLGYGTTCMGEICSPRSPRAQFKNSRVLKFFFFDKCRMLMFYFIFWKKQNADVVYSI